MLTAKTTINGATAVMGDRALMTVIHCNIAVTRNTVLAGFRNCSASDFGKKFSSVYLVVLI
jgi:hypothetical protein